MDEAVQAAVARIFARIKELFSKSNAFANESDLSPDILSIRDAINALPCPVDVLIVDGNIPDGYGGEASASTSLLHFDFSRSSGDVRFHGRMAYASLMRDPRMLEEVFHWKVGDEFFADLLRSGKRCYGESDNHWATLVASGSIENDVIDEIAEGLYHFRFVMGAPAVIKQFSRKIDWNREYRLTPDPIRTLEEITSRSEITAGITPTWGSSARPSTVEDYQARIAQVQLIPKVPEDVYMTFKMTKLLFTYAFFEHYFGTVAAHYLYLTVEAAAKSRWVRTLPDPFVVTNKKGDRETLRRDSHQAIFKFLLAKKSGWHPKSIKVEGEPFPDKHLLIIESLKRKGVVTGWQARQLDYYLRSRNVYSHREFATVMPIGASDIEAVTDLVNSMFHSL